LATHDSEVQRRKILDVLAATSNSETRELIVAYKGLIVLSHVLQESPVLAELVINCVSLLPIRSRTVVLSSTLVEPLRKITEESASSSLPEDVIQNITGMLAAWETLPEGFVIQRAEEATAMPLSLSSAMEIAVPREHLSSATETLLNRVRVAWTLLFPPYY
jgi:hypothetical protein